uniref:Nuclear receptor domain-containing protein n=1 Tax=Strongyloides stercoralis TaxID=6248 RepID=A0AAF5DEV7_STRER
MESNQINDNEECLVCTDLTKSTHCSVNSCSFIIAFFRRSVLGNYIYKCRRGSKKCQIKPKDKYFCKYCRYEKCKAVGMTIKKYNNDNKEEIDLNKIQCNSNVIISDSDTSCSSSSKIIVERYKIIQNQLIFDIQETKNLIKNIFEGKIYGTPSMDGFQLTCLQKVIQGIEYLKRKLNVGSREEISILLKIEFRQYLRFWEKFIICAAEMLMHIPEFVLLPNDKKVHYSILLSSINNEEILIIDEKNAHPINNFKLVIFEMTDTIAKKFDDMTKPFTQFLDIHLLQPMKFLKLENIEIAYLIIQMLFSHVNNEKLYSEFQSDFDKIIRISNDELHNYYYYNKKITNYAYRITEMTKLLSMLKEYSVREREIILATKWLNIFDLSVIDKF